MLLSHFLIRLAFIDFPYDLLFNPHNLRRNLHNSPELRVRDDRYAVVITDNDIRWMYGDASGQEYLSGRRELDNRNSGLRKVQLRHALIARGF
jgi:hypothetical protein